MALSRQWSFVLVIVAGLVGGAAALTVFGADVGRVAVGSAAPDFRAPNLATGDTVSIRRDYRGKVTLVNIWATWCVPCRIEMPAMEQVYRDLAPRGFAIAAVSIDEGDPADVETFVRELGLSFDILHDRSTSIQQVYQTTGVPESFLLDRRGVIVKRVIGAHDWNSEANRTLIERLLDQPDR
ncbi:MAG: TlpA disulfide reductase family protein [Gemmatimonadales bacterium]